MKWTRLPFEPVEAQCARAGVTFAAMEKDTGIKASRARVDGLNIDQADRVAFYLHLHPLVLFGDLYLWVQPWPEEEPGNTFCGRPLEYRAIGRNRYYGLYEVAA